MPMQSSQLIESSAANDSVVRETSSVSPEKLYIIMDVLVLQILAAMKRSLDAASSLICQLRGEEGGDPQVIERLWVDLEIEKKRHFALRLVLGTVLQVDLDNAEERNLALQLVSEIVLLFIEGTT
jgi:hypothetical protein